MPAASIAAPDPRSPREDRSGTARPEQTFFDDPVLDRLMGVTVALAAEVYTLRSRVIELERRVPATPQDTVPSDPASDAALAREDAARFVARLFEPLSGEQQAKGPVAR